MGENFTEWKDFEKELNITPEQEMEIRLEMETIRATIKHNKNRRENEYIRYCK